MFHVKQFINNLINRPIHELLFYVFLFLLPIQTRTLFKPETPYINWYFNYHLAFFFYLTDILLIACFVSWLMFDRPNPNILLKRLFWLILAFFSLILVTLFHVKRLDLGLYQASKWLEVLILVLYVSQISKTQLQFRIASWIIFISALIQSLIGLIQFHVQHSLKLDLLGEYIAPFGTSGLATIQTSAGKLIRAYGTFPHPNILGAFLVLGLICGLFLVSHGTKGHKIAISLGLFLISLGLFVSFSRLAWLSGAIAILGFLTYFWIKREQVAGTAIMMICLVSCATILVFAPKTLKARISDTNQASITDRTFFNQLGLDMTKRFPVLGVGVGNYVEALKDLFVLDPWQYQPAHNIFIFIAAELGILGVSLFIMILFEIFSVFKNIVWEPLTFSLAVLGILFLLMSQFDHYFVTIQQGRLMFFIVLGLIAALPNLYAQKSD
jgi:O-antigen ligase